MLTRALWQNDRLRALSDIKHECKICGILSCTYHTAWWACCPVDIRKPVNTWAPIHKCMSPPWNCSVVELNERNYCLFNPTQVIRGHWDWPKAAMWTQFAGSDPITSLVKASMMAGKWRVRAKHPTFSVPAEDTCTSSFRHQHGQHSTIWCWIEGSREIPTNHKAPIPIRQTNTKLMRYVVNTSSGWSLSDQHNS